MREFILQMTVFAFIVVMVFLLLGIVNGWKYAPNYIIGFCMFLVGWLVLSHLSADSQIKWKGVTTQDTITNRKEETNRCCQGKLFYVQYTYSVVDGMAYENTNDAWFQFHNS